MSPEKLAPFISSPLDAVAMALAVADVNENDIVYDLGCGDGRVAIVSSKHLGARSVCVEIDPDLCVLAEANAWFNGVLEQVRIMCNDFMKVDLSPATVVYTYLYSSINRRLAGKLEREMRPGSRVVTLDFPIPGWVPFKVRRFYDEKGYLRTVWLYVIGVSNPGSWRV